jgi:chorismate dehydratase
LDKRSVARLRVSAISYLNAAPLVWGLTEGGSRGRFEVSFTIPSRCADELRQGKADIGLIPSIEYALIPGLVIAPDIAIAAKNEVRSIVLASRKPVSEIRRVALDQSSRTSAALLKILFRKYYRVEPEYVSAAPDTDAMLADADAALLIGNPAFLLHFPEVTGTRRASKRSGEGHYQLLDMAAEWRRWTGHAFVFAFWAGRAEAITAEVVGALQESKREGLLHLEEICEREAARLGLPREAVRQYLTENVDFSFDDENRRGLECFYRLAKEAGLIPEVRPLKFAPAEKSVPLAHTT